MEAALLVLLILAGIVLVQAAILVPLVLTWRKGSDRYLADFRTAAAASGEGIVAGPEKAVYRGGTKPYSAVKGNGTIILTDRRLVFRKLSGGLVEVPREAITDVRQSKGFRGSRVGGATHLVVATSEPAEVAFFVQDIAAWERALDPSGFCRE